LARWISILWHPLIAVSVSVFLATAQAGHPGPGHGQDVRVSTGMLLLAVAGFIAWQFGRGRWAHVDAIRAGDRRSLNHFLLVVLIVATALASVRGVPELAIGLGATAACMATVILCSRWLKISQHCLFATLPLAWLWPSIPITALFIAMALLVAASRLALGRHTRAEVMCGIVLGAAAAIAVNLVSTSPILPRP
jgi:membrane-associated phospholipid phosphatase